MRVSILAATFAGNKGAAAMLVSLVKNLPKDYKYNLLSVYPSEDEKQNPFQNLEVVSAKPEKIIFMVFPLAVAYYVLKGIGPIKKALLKHPVLKSIFESEMVIDVAGITFVDSRGFIMNTYNFICIAIPLLMGKKIVKYSQALGPFHSIWNRLWAKIALPKVAKICARGAITYSHLKELKLDNVALCADGAFIMPEDEAAKQTIKKIISEDEVYSKNFVTVSVSSVVEGYCEKNNIQYREIMSMFIDFLIEEKGYGVLIIANAARKNSTKSKNNDLLVCQEVFARVKNKEFCRYYNEEFTPEEIREYISYSKFMIASRFHAMIGALYKEVPVLLIGWSHKYQEVLDMFYLGKNAIDYKELSLENLIEKFTLFEQEETENRIKLRENLGNVQKSAMNNIEIIKDLAREV